VLAVLLALGCGALAFGHVRAVLSVTRGDTEALTRRLMRVPAPERVQALLDGTEAGSWEHALAAEVLAAPNEGARVAAVNLALADAEHELERTARWPPTALRLAALGALLLGGAAYLADGDDLRWLLSILAAGGVAVLGCIEAGRSGDRHAARQRRAIDALVATALPLSEALPEGRAASAATASPAPRRRRRPS
jgi:hypothetical protein